MKLFIKKTHAILLAIPLALTINTGCAEKDLNSSLEDITLITLLSLLTPQSKYKWENISSSTGLDPRFGQAITVHLNNLYLLSGARSSTGIVNVYNTVHSSTDEGANWNSLTQNTPFTARVGASLSKLNNRYYLIGGGVNEGNTNNDVFDTDNFTDWNPGAGGFSPRIGHTAVVFNNKLWVIAGGNTSDFSSDVWSFDGAVIRHAY